ncbi:MAG: GNAT family N-acetyltransferase [Ktedonobacteraceae bacterium]|nr:GNAT family N-acetyltransferase [Ktedonobacteraceae bacterium]
MSDLLRACNTIEGGPQANIQQKMDACWHRPGFDLKTDAWVIVTTAGQFVGYASVWQQEPGRIDSMVHVHPAFRGRGIGTLLLRLVELRARKFASDALAGMRVVLCHVVSVSNEGAKQLLEREGYTLVTYFWRVAVDTSITAADPDRDESLFEFEVAVDSRNTSGAPRLSGRIDRYIARQYATYERRLRAGDEACEDGAQLNMQSALIEDMQSVL